MRTEKHPKSSRNAMDAGLILFYGFILVRTGTLHTVLVQYRYDLGEKQVRISDSEMVIISSFFKEDKVK